MNTTTALAIGYIGTRREMCALCGDPVISDRGFALIELSAIDSAPVCRPCGEAVDPNLAALLQRVIDAEGQDIQRRQNLGLENLPTNLQRTA